MNKRKKHSRPASIPNNGREPLVPSPRQAMQNAVVPPSYSASPAIARPSSAAGSVSPAEPPALPSPEPSSQAPRSLPVRIVSHWLFWMTTSIAITGGVAGFAGATLFKIPGLPDCPQIFWPTASAALRMHCAEQSAEKNTARSLLAAIKLVDGLPETHPMRAQVDDMIEQWAAGMLDLAEISFHNGDLEGAIAAAKRVPDHVEAYQQVDERIETWTTIWDEAEAIYDEAETLIGEEETRRAFSMAIKLLSIGNDYWATDRYDALTGLIATAREEIELLSEARRIAQRKTVDALLDAVEKVESIPPESRLYAAARRTLSRFWDQLVTLGVEALKRGDADVVTRVSRSLPGGLEFRAQSQDLQELSFALAQADSGLIPDIEAAIAQAKRLTPNRPLYGQAQDLIADWTLEIKDIRVLSRARQLAALGTIPDLQAAIAEAQLVGRSHPRSDEARSTISKWTREIQTLQDEPHLQDARRLASLGNVRGLDAAIQKARLIANGRPLYPEARELIDEWTQDVQSIQDQPYLDNARELAAQGKLTAAIAAAQRIAPGRILHDEAQGNIRQWQDQINGDVFLQDAYLLAQRGTPTGLERAIRVARRIPLQHENRANANRMVEQWSQTLLRLAQQTARTSYEDAIAIAELVPDFSNVYDTAQSNIAAWQQVINRPTVDWVPTSPYGSSDRQPNAEQSAPEASPTPPDDSTDSSPPPTSTRWDDESTGT